MRVPFLDLTAQLRTTGPAVERAVLEVVRSGRYVGGPVLDAFEAAMADYLEVDHAVAVSSGTDALLVALMALEVGRGDLVITTPYSFFATAGVVARLGATPVFVDIDPRTFNIDCRALSAWWDANAVERTRVKAIIPVHLFGQCADMDPILELAAAHRIPVVEDAAQALGARHGGSGGDGDGDGYGSAGRRVGGLGAFGCFSFYPTKNLGAMGHGGLVATGDADLATTVRRLRDHGAHPPYHHARVGGNFQLDAVQAAVLSAKLPHLDTWHQARRARAVHYDRRLRLGGISPPAPPPRPDSHVYNQYVIRVPSRRDALRAHLAAQGIGTMVYYPVPLHRQTCFHHLGYGRGAFPHSEEAAATSLALPIYPELSQAMQDRVVEEIAAFYRSGA